MERIGETSPQVYARIGGVLYLIIIVIGFSSEFFVRDKLVVSGDVTATANNIAASESLWRISIAMEGAGQRSGGSVIAACPARLIPCFA